MRKGPRIVALFALFLMVAPLPLELLGEPLGAKAQSDPLAGLLPQGVGWNDWPLTHKLYAHQVPSQSGGTPCPNDPSTNLPSGPSDLICPLPMDLNAPAATVPALSTVKATVSGAPTSPDSAKAFIRLDPPTAESLHITGMHAVAYVTFGTPPTSCQISSATGSYGVTFVLRALPSGDAGTSSEAGIVIGQGTRDNLCPADYTPGGVCPCVLEADLAPKVSDPGIDAQGRLRLDITVTSNLPGQTWQLNYDATSAQTRVELVSNDAYQYSMWTTDANDKTKPSTTFPIPVDSASRDSVIGWFGFKDAWGGYDNPEVSSSPPQPATDAQWTMQVIAPDGTPVNLRDPTVHPDAGEFHKCGVLDPANDSDADLKVCLIQGPTSSDVPPSAKVFRMPDRPHVAGTSDIWNYTRGRMAQIAPCKSNPDQPCGGEFKLRISGHVHANSIEGVVPDGLHFNVGGFGLTLAGLKVGDLAENVQPDGSIVHTVVPGQSTTFLLNITNVGARADNYTLSAAFRSPADPTGWSVDFGGKPVLGQNQAFLQGGNSSILKVTVTPPAGSSSGSAVVRVRAASVSAPDQFVERDLTTQISGSLVHGTGLFLFPEPSQKSIPRGGSAIFNFTVWNRGTEPDSFSVKCTGGPDLSLLPGTLQRHDDSWNGSLAFAGTTIGCVDTNTDRTVSVPLGPGDTADVRVVLQSNFNNTLKPMSAQVEAKSQKDSQKSMLARATAVLESKSSFKLFILTDGLANPDDPLSQVTASRVLRFGKDSHAVCPNPVNPDPGVDCSTNGDAEGPPVYPYDYSQTPVSQQHIDTNFSEFALYRLQILNDGDASADFALRVGRIANQTEQNPNQDSACRSGNPNSFDAVHMRDGANLNGMNDNHFGVVLLRRPTLNQTPSEQDVIAQGDNPGTLHVDPQQVGVFYLRVRNEWNRDNLSTIYGSNSGLNEVNVGGPICDSRSTVDVQVSSNAFPFPKATVTAVTLSRNVAVSDNEKLPANVIITDVPQPCPPVTSEGSQDRLFCRYAEPGTTVNWTFIATKFTPIRDTFTVGAVKRVGGFSLTDLRNRGWVVPNAPSVEFPNDPGFDPQPDDSSTCCFYANGDEIRVSIEVTVPKNATINDFAGLTVDVCAKLANKCQTFTFYTVGAQLFKLTVKNLNADTQFIHPGDRAAVNLNISNEGAAVDIYNVTVTSKVDPWGVTYQPNETRVAPGHNKTVTVFLQSPAVGPLPAPLSGTVRVQSEVNTSFVAGKTGADVPFQVVVKPRGPDDIRLGLNFTLNETETKPVNSGGTVTFNINVTNPGPNQVKVKLRRIPEGLSQFVDGWSDLLGEGPNCIDVDGHGGTRGVSFTVTAAADALEGTHVTYVLRADQADSNCNVPAPKDSTNFAQLLVTATVVGKSGLDVQPLQQNLVVPRGGNVLFPVKIRNIGTADDTFFFTPTFVNQSQPLPPDAWGVSVEVQPPQVPTPQCPDKAAVIHSLFLDAGANCIVLVNLSAPVNVPQTGVRSDLDFGVRGTQASPQVVRLTGFVQDYALAIRLPNATVDAVPGETRFFTLNLTNTGNGLDDFKLEVNVGGLSGYWNISTELDNAVVPCGQCITLLNGTSRDIQIAVQVPKVPLPTTGAVIGVTVRSQRAESLRPAAQALGLGSPIVALLNNVPKTSLLSVNLYPYVSLDVDGDRDPELAVDRNKNPLDGFEVLVDPFTAVIQSVDSLAADGDGDGKIDHFIDINLDGKPDRYWSPDKGTLTVIAFDPDVNNDGTLEYVYDSDGDLAVDHWIDPITRQTGIVIQKDFDDDGNPEFLIDTNGDGRPDKYFDPDRGPHGLVTSVEPGPGGNLQMFAIDTNGSGHPTKLYNRVTGEVQNYTVSGVVEFVTSYWYLLLVFALVVVLAAYLVLQRRGNDKGSPPEPPPR